jgi:thiamine kinase-like enzyme
MALDQEKATGCATPVKDRGFLSPLQDELDRNHIEVIVRLICAVHDTFKEHPRLDEYRRQSTDLGSRFLNTSVQNAIGALEDLPASNTALSQKHLKARNHLLERLERLREQLSWRNDLLEQAGGPHTLLHGDLSVKNAFVMHTEHGLSGRLIDWDHAGVGPASYDLSTFLMQLPVQDRLWTLDLYTSVRAGGTSGQLSGDEWNLLFETHEFARLANSVIWPARAATEGQSAWAFEELEKTGEWFDGLSPVLPAT